MNATVQPGEIRRNTVLGTQATYEVLAVDGESVRVAAIEVPGLPRGTELRLTLDAVRGMEAITSERALPAERAFRGWTKPRPMI